MGAEPPGAAAKRRAFSRAAVNAPKRNACGVSARHKPSRGTVAATTASSEVPAALASCDAARFTVSATGSASKAPLACPAGVTKAASKAPSSSALRQGRAASCTSTQSSSAPPRTRTALRPASTLSAREAPPVVVVTCGCWASGNAAKRASAAPRATTTPRRFRLGRLAVGSLAAAFRNGTSACSMTKPPGSSSYCLGTAPPKRSPRPAAGRTTQ